MKTLKQTLEEHCNSIKECWKNDDSCITCLMPKIREWLQQKQPKLTKNYEWNDGWSYNQKTIKKLLEELEQK